MVRTRKASVKYLDALAFLDSHDRGSALILIQILLYN